MSHKRRFGLVLLMLGVAVLLGAVLGVLLNQPEEPVRPLPGPVIARFIPAYATPQYGWVAYATINDNYATPIPRPTHDPNYPGNYPIGQECQEYMDAVWNTSPDGADTCLSEPCSTSNIDWTEYDNCINSAAAQTVTLSSGTVISQPVVLTFPGRWMEEESDACGTAGDPCLEDYFPAWMNALGWAESFTRTGTSNYYWGVRFDNVSFLNRMKQFVTEAGARYGDSANVVAIRVNVGHTGETHPIQCDANDSGCRESCSSTSSYPTYCTTSLLYRHETEVASCDAYRAFVTGLANAAYDAFGNKPVFVAAGTGMCSHPSYDNAWETRKYLWEDATVGWTTASTKRNVGWSLNAIDPDRADAWGYGGETYENYKTYSFGPKVESYATPGPVMWEYTWNPGASVTFSDDFQHNVWTAYAGAALGGDGLMPFTGWNDNFSDLYWEVVDYQLGNNDDRAWIVLRDQEWPTYRINTNPLYASGVRGDFDEHIQILTPEAYEQYCNQNLINQAATAVFGATPTPVIKPCGITNGTQTPQVLPTYAATVQATPSPDATSQYNILQRVAGRQARRMDASEKLGVLADTNWVHYGVTKTVTIGLTYLDLGTDDVTVLVNKTGTDDSHVIDKVNSGLWKRETWTVTNAYIHNDIAVTAIGDAFIEVDNGASTVLYLHELYFDVSGEATPTPSPTATGVPQGQLFGFSYADTNNNRTYDAGVDTLLVGNYYFVTDGGDFSKYLCDPFATDNTGNGCTLVVTAGTVYTLTTDAGWGSGGANYVAAVTPALDEYYVQSATAAPTASGTPGSIQFVYVTTTPLATNTFTPVPTQTFTPSATPSYSPTPSPTRTRTPRPTATGVTPTATRTPTSTPDWVTLNCPAITPVVNGVLAEWGAVTPVALNSTSSTIIQPPTPSLGLTPTPTGTAVPSGADLAGTLYCGYSGSTLYFAGTIIDNVKTAGVTYQTSGALSIGDAVRITLDGNRDGLVDVGGYDHDLYIAPNGRVLDFDRYPISTTVSVVTVAGGWTFELALSASEIGLTTPTTGNKWGLVWHLLDDDDGTGIQHVLDDRKRMATIP